MRTLTVMLLTVLALAACKGRDGTPPSTARRSGTRIISTVPAATIIIVQLGAADTLVGVSRYDDINSLPENKRSLPAVGDYETMSKELLVRLDPTTLIVYASPEKLDQSLRSLARDRNIDLLNLRFDRLDDLWVSAETLGRLTGKQDEAKTQSAAARATIERVKQKVGNRPKPRVLYVSTIGGMMAAGKGTFIEELITAAGGTNVGAEVGVGYPPLNAELTLRLRPDVILIGEPGGPPEQANDPRTAPWLKIQIPAARAKRVHVLTDPNTQLATLTIGDTVRHMAELFHPDVSVDYAFEETQPTTTRARP